MSDKSTETHSFQAEVGQLLDIVTHSLYTDREIFVRELVSNASDALEKLRHIQLTEKSVFDADAKLEINITTDEEANTITIQDAGIGMTREELVEHIGTIAKSGSKAFAEAIKNASKSEESGAELIGQFGVGFYSAFMVADKVDVYTHSWKTDAESLKWSSDGKSGFEITEVDAGNRGAKIVMHLKEDAKEFAKTETIKAILKRYSSFVQHPINLDGEQTNTVQAIWLRSKDEITDDEYTDFYKYQANAFDEPMFRLHFNADAPLEINSLLFTPKENMERFGFGRMEPGVALYSKKVLIDPKPEGLLPEWLRFLKGVIDSADLPLNISRESMQDSALVKKLGTVITNRYIKSLSEVAKKSPETYDEFYKNFHVFIKEGVTSDFAVKEKLSKLLRFESSLTEDGKMTSLADYVSRMKEEQKEIYFLQAADRSVIEQGPYMEAFKAQNIEVLYLYEPIDEFVMSNLMEFDGKKITSADSSDIELEDVSDNAEGESMSEEVSTSLREWMKESFGSEKVEDVIVSKRLVGQPAMAVNADKFMTPSMRRMMKAMDQDNGAPLKVNLEINAKHPLIKKLAVIREKNEEVATLIADQIFDNSLIAAGYMEDPRPVVDRIYKIMEKIEA